MSDTDTDNMEHETVEVGREIFDDTVGLLKDIERILSGSTAYNKADTVRRYRKKLENEAKTGCTLGEDTDQEVNK